MNLCVLYGGNSNEREVSLASCEMVFNSLDKNKYNIKLVEIGGENGNKWVREIVENPPDAVLSALHGGTGENGSVQGFLKCMNIPYVGSDVLSSSICMDKNISKIIMAANHIPCAEGILINSPEELGVNKCFIEELGLPLVIKPNSGGSSVGISIVNKFEDVNSACDSIFAMGDKPLIEKYYQGREVTCAIIEKNGEAEILGILDILPQTEFYDYKAKYVDTNTYIGLSDLPSFILRMIEEIGKKAFKCLQCKDYARLDMIVYKEQVIVLEMNTLPGLTSHSLVPKAAQSLEGGFSELLDFLIDKACGKRV